MHCVGLISAVWQSGNEAARGGWRQATRRGPVQDGEDIDEAFRQAAEL